MNATVLGAIAIAVAVCILLFVVMPFGLAFLWRWLMPRAITYAKAQYPDSWHLPSTSRWLWLTAIVSFAACFVIPGVIADLAGVIHLNPESPATDVICSSMIVIFEVTLWATAFALRLKDRLRGEIPHVFVPRWSRVHSTVYLIASSAPGMPEPVRRWIERWIMPVEQSWRCDLCGDIRRSQKHAV
jgi:hypothetical protein